MSELLLLKFLRKSLIFTKNTFSELNLELGNLELKLGT